jgi:hypothetical protein
MTKLIDAMKAVNDLNRSHGVTQRGGKKYTEVYVRVEQFRMAFGETLGIDTNILVDDGKRVVIKATVTKDGMTIGSGMAEEIRGSTNVNKTSAIENCETSAIGRALASLGLHGGSYASANEIAAVQRKEQAQQEQAQTPATKPQPAQPDVSVHPLEPEEPQTTEMKPWQAYYHNGQQAGPAYDKSEDYRERLIALFRKYQTDGRSQVQLDQLWQANFNLIDQLGENDMMQVQAKFEAQKKMAKQ